ncbi:MAG: hypothetical protein OHK0017_05280 [Patescibacteria group bacterium]
MVKYVLHNIKFYAFLNRIQYIVMGRNFLQAFFGYSALLFILSNIFSIYIIQRNFTIWNLAVFGLVLICVLVSLLLYKRQKIQDLDKLMQSPDLLKNINKISLETGQLTIEEVEKLRNEFVLKQSTALILFALSFIGINFVITPFICIPFGIYLIRQSQKLKPQLKAWIIHNKLQIDGLTEPKYVADEYKNSLFNSLFIQKLVLQNSAFKTVKIDDALVFNYKGKPVELYEFKPDTNDDEENNKNTYICLTTTNPDKIEGTSVAWSGKRWKFNLPEKVRTESVVFDKIFKAASTGQLEARLHMKTNVMQDMIDLNQQLAGRETVFYFHNSQIYIFFKYIGNAFEPNLQKSLKQNIDTVDPLKKDIELGLKIFDDFWLSRKSGYGHSESEVNSKISTLVESVQNTENDQLTSAVSTFYKTKNVVKTAYIIIVSCIFAIPLLFAGYFSATNIIKKISYERVEGKIAEYIVVIESCNQNRTKTNSGSNSNSSSSCMYRKRITYTTGGVEKSFETDYSTSVSDYELKQKSEVKLLANPNPNVTDAVEDGFLLWLPVIIFTVVFVVYIFVLFIGKFLISLISYRKLTTNL